MQTFKHLLGGAIIAIIALVSCAKNEVATTTSDTITDATSQYMAVNITMGSGTKSTNYEAGTTAEQTVATDDSGFLFYDDNGNYVTYGEFSEDPEWTEGSDNIENYTTSVILGPTATSPTQVLAIFNNSSWKNYIGKSLTAVMELTTEDEWTSSSETFAMASAGLYNGSSYTVTAEISDENLCETEEEALAEPVTIYVERQAVKVTISPQNTYTEGDTYILQDTDKSYYATLANSITYVDWGSEPGKSTVSASAKIVVDGWALNATNSSSHVVKNYDSAVVDDWYESSIGNYLWAQDDNYTYSESDSYGDDASGIYEGVSYLPWSDVTETSTDASYTHENTIDSSGQSAVDAANTPAATPTVLLAAHITLDTNSDGTYDVDPSSSTDDDTGFYYNSGVLFSKDGIIAQALEELSGTYTNSDGDALTPDDLTITLGASSSATTNSSVYVVTEVTINEGKSVYKDNSEIKDTDDLLSALNGTSYLATGTDDDGNTTGLQYYNSGHCYYQAVITTEGADDNTAYGVVRNHIYYITLNTISWIGGPVADDDEKLIIIPGSDETTYLAAEVNVLKWITVSQTVDF